MAEMSRSDLFLRIKQHLKDEESRELRTYVESEELLPAGEIEHLNPQEIFLKLEHKLKLPRGDLSLLVELMTKIGRDNFAKEAETVAAQEKEGTSSCKQRRHPMASPSSSPKQKIRRTSEGRPSSMLIAVSDTSHTSDSHTEFPDEHMHNPLLLDIKKKLANEDLSLEDRARIWKLKMELMDMKMDRINKDEENKVKIQNLKATFLSPQSLETKYDKIEAKFEEERAIVKRVYKDCLIFFLDFETKSNFEHFWGSYTSGRLSDSLSRVLTGDQVQRLQHGDQLVHVVRTLVLMEDYRAWRDFFRKAVVLDRANSADNLLTLPPPARHVASLSLRSLDLAVTSREDQLCREGTDDISALNFTVRQVQTALQTCRKKSQQQLKVQLQTMQGHLESTQMAELKKEVKRLTSTNEKAEAIFSKQKAELNEKVQQLQETNKNMAAKIEEMQSAKQVEESGSQPGEMVRSLTKEITRLKENEEKAQKILLEQKEENQKLSEVNKSTAATIEELINALHTAKARSQEEDPEKDPGKEEGTGKDPGKEEDPGKMEDPGKKEDPGKDPGKEEDPGKMEDPGKDPGHLTEDKKMVSTGAMTGLYNTLLTCLIRKCCEREGVHMPTEGLPTEVAESLLQLGKLALEALLRNETLLDLTEVEREKVDWQLLLKLGVVSLEVSSPRLHPRKQLIFSHKTMQQFLAGRYVAHAQVNQDIVELLQPTSISKVIEHRNLLQFTCGCDSQAAQAVMEELCKLSSKEFSHLQPDDFSFNKAVNPKLRGTVDTYKAFVLLCLDILNERKDLNVLEAVSRALPVVIIDNLRNSKQQAALKYHLENIQSLHLPDRMVLRMSHRDTTEALQFLEQTFASPIPGLQLDLTLRGVKFHSPDETARLVSVLRNIPSLRALHLSYKKLTPSSLQPLVQGFRHMSLLEELDLSNNPDLGDAGMEVLQVGLSSVPHLAILCLGLVNMTAVGMSSLAPYMRHLVGLRELDISDNKMGDIGLESLTTVLHTFTAMQVLCLIKTGISPTGMRTLVPALCKLTRLIKLDISYNAIGDPGLECLAAILHLLTAMKVLRLSGTRISDRGISSLIKALPHLVQLQVLDVSLNNIGDSGIASLVQTLCQPSSLDMEQNPPGDKSLTTAPHYNTTLQELYIGPNRGVTGAGLGRVAQLISTLPALTRLNMSGHPDTPAHLSDTAATDLAEALPRLPALERLGLWYISMEPAGFQAVIQAAEEHPTLGELGYSEMLLPKGADTSASCLRFSVRLH